MTALGAELLRLVVFAQVAAVLVGEIVSVGAGLASLAGSARLQWEGREALAGWQPLQPVVQVLLRLPAAHVFHLRRAAFSHHRRK